MSAFLAGTYRTENAVANGDTRTISIYHTHSKETATITFKRDGQYDRAGLEQLNYILRDWRTDEKTSMDARLFDVVWQVHREVGSNEPIHVVSAYRAPATNAMLRRRSRAVAENSQHMLGKAIDFFLPDVPAERIRASGMRLQGGGVGYYPTSYNPFVHLDVGSVRAWPRMTHDQLARLFPDGKTVHLPTDGMPFPRYEEAKAEILARGGAVAGLAYAQADDPGFSIKSFWSRFFGGIDEAEDREIARSTASQRTATKPVLASLSGSDEVDTSQPVGLTWLEKLVGGAESGAATAQSSGQGKRPQIALGPLPPRRPDSLGGSAGPKVPLPPTRPVMLAALRGAPDDGTVASDESSRQELTALIVAASNHPLPPRRPSLPDPDDSKAIASRIDAVHAMNRTFASDHTLTSLYGNSVTGSVPQKEPPPAHTAKTRGSSDAESIAGAIPGSREFGRSRFAPASGKSTGFGFR